MCSVALQGVVTVLGEEQHNGGLPSVTVCQSNAIRCTCEAFYDESVLTANFPKVVKGAAWFIYIIRVSCYAALTSNWAAARMHSWHSDELCSVRCYPRAHTGAAVLVHGGACIQGNGGVE